MKTSISAIPIPGQFFELAPKHQRLIADHLIRLDPNSKIARFCGHLSDGAIREYVESFAWHRQLIVGYVIDGRLRGVAELGWKDWQFPRHGELAISVEAEWRQLEIASCLLEFLLSVSRSRLVATVEAEFLYENVAVQALLRKFGFRFERREALLKGTLELGRPTQLISADPGLTGLNEDDSWKAVPDVLDA